MATQTSYSENMDVGKVGALVNTEPHHCVSGTVEDAAGIGFGVVVKRGANDGGIAATEDGDTAGLYGITVRERSLDANTPDAFPKYASARVMLKGMIWAQASVAVDDGDPVYVTVDGGALSKTSGAGKVLLPNATWESTTSGAGLAKLRIL